MGSKNRMIIRGNFADSSNFVGGGGSSTVVMLYFVPSRDAFLERINRFHNASPQTVDKESNPEA